MYQQSTLRQEHRTWHITGLIRLWGPGSAVTTDVTIVMGLPASCHGRCSKQNMVESRMGDQTAGWTTSLPSTHLITATSPPLRTTWGQNKLPPSPLVYCCRTVIYTVYAMESADRRTIMQVIYVEVAQEDRQCWQLLCLMRLFVLRDHTVVQRRSSSHGRTDAHTRPSGTLQHVRWKVCCRIYRADYALVWLTVEPFVYKTSLKISDFYAVKRLDKSTQHIYRHPEWYCSSQQPSVRQSRATDSPPDDFRGSHVLVANKRVEWRTQTSWSIYVSCEHLNKVLTYLYLNSQSVLCTSSY